MECPVCYSQDIEKNLVKHHEFEGYFWHECRLCKHIFTDCKNVYISDESFHTREERSNRYLDYIFKGKEKPPKSLLEVGSANDFYFLTNAHRINPKTELFLNDSYDYSQRVPPYITFIKSLKNLPKEMDICYMCHSFEHIIDPDAFLKILKPKIRKFIIEIPISLGKIWFLERREGRNCSGWHYHYYTKGSLIGKFKQFGYQYTELRIPHHKYNQNFTFERIND